MMNVRDAMKDDAPPLHDDLTTTELGEDTDKHSNIVTHFRFEQGDLEKGFAEANVIVEQESPTLPYTKATSSPKTVRPCGTRMVK